jgi:FkbH-like protein
VQAQAPRYSPMDINTISLEQIILKRRSLERELSQRDGLQPLRVAILGGSTTNELTELLEVYLLAAGFAPRFYQSEYGQFYEDAVFNTGMLKSFAPDLVYIHTNCLNLRFCPPAGAREEDFEAAVAQELARYELVWDALDSGVGCQIIQNNFELPPTRLLGNLDAVSPGGATRYHRAMNAALARASAGRPRVVLQDVASLSAQLGLTQWFDWNRWFSYKLPLSVEANQLLARSLTALVLALYGGSRKVLVLDLDNTLWGGVIGDDGVEGIQIGRETPLAEAFTAFQEYCLALRNRGVLLAVCTKNFEEMARAGFDHPNSVLKLEHFSAFRANWEPKHENILSIARELNLDPASFVFVDENPAERAIVAAQIAGIAVPDLGSDPSCFTQILDAQRYFEPVALSGEDFARAHLYAAGAARNGAQNAFANYDEYLASLEMVAEIGCFPAIHLDRIAQLTNRTNQFNLTTRRYTRAEIESAANDPMQIGLYGRLNDRFGDYGLVSVILGHRKGDALGGDVLHLDLWLMSCRVLKRNMEMAMLDALVHEACAAGISEIVGYYIPSPKNAMVKNHYADLGFSRLPGGNDGKTAWSLGVSGYSDRTRHISIVGAKAATEARMQAAR